MKSKTPNNDTGMVIDDRDEIDQTVLAMNFNDK